MYQAGKRRNRRFPAIFLRSSRTGIHCAATVLNNMHKNNRKVCAKRLVELALSLRIYLRGSTNAEGSTVYVVQPITTSGGERIWHKGAEGRADESTARASTSIRQRDWRSGATAISPTAPRETANQPDQAFVFGSTSARTRLKIMRGARADTRGFLLPK